MEPEVSIQSLLDRIKAEGIEEARNASEKILKDARSQAASIVAQAKKEAQDIHDRTQAEIQRDREAFESAMAQAGRNLMIGLKHRILGLCNYIMERRVHDALGPELLTEMILKMVDRWLVREGYEQVEVLLKETDLRKLEDLLLQSLQENFKEGVLLKPAEGVQAGFRIGEKGGSMHYDFTDKGLAEILDSYLGPRIARFLDEASEER